MYSSCCPNGASFGNPLVPTRQHPPPPLQPFLPPQQPPPPQTTQPHPVNGSGNGNATGSGAIVAALPDGGVNAIGGAAAAAAAAATGAAYCCSHQLVSAASREAAQLTEAERDMILGVLRRNEKLQRDQQNRIMRLKAELQNLRRRGALKASADYDSIGPDPDRSCGRCRVELGRVINRGAFCRACRLKVCKGCREYSLRTTDWVCTVCHKHMYGEIQAASGEWMNEFVRRPSRRRDNRVYVPAADLIKRTIRRSWTISNPSPPKWTAPRGSTQARPYSSLPRGQDMDDPERYPTLAVHRTNARNNMLKPEEAASAASAVCIGGSPDRNHHSPARRSHSEDVYSDREIKITELPLLTPTPPNSAHTPKSPSPFYPSSAEKSPKSPKLISISTDNPSHPTTPKTPPSPIPSPRPVRVNPLIKYASERRSKEPKTSSRLSRANAESSTSKSFDLPPTTTTIITTTTPSPPKPEPESRSESEDEEVQTFMLGTKSPRRKLIQHARTESNTEATGKHHHFGNHAGGLASAFRSLDTDRRMGEKRVSFDKESSVSPSHRLKKVEDVGSMRKRAGTSPSRSILSYSGANSPVRVDRSSLSETDHSDSNVQENTHANATTAMSLPELCDIEPLSGTVFRKVTVRRRRQDMRKMAAVDNGAGGAQHHHHHHDVAAALLAAAAADGDDYKLVFGVSSDSSSKEEDADDYDSCSTASSSFPTVDECDWDYFEPLSSAQAASKPSPLLGSPLLYSRKRLRDSSDDDTTSQSSSTMEVRHSHTTAATSSPTSTTSTTHCRNCGGSGVSTSSTATSPQYVPVPIPVPIPVPMLPDYNGMWNPQDCLVRYSPDVLEQAMRAQLRVLPRSLLPLIVNQAALVWPLIAAAAAAAAAAASANPDVAAAMSTSAPKNSSDTDASNTPKCTIRGSELEQQSGALDYAPSPTVLAEAGDVQPDATERNTLTQPPAAAAAAMDINVDSPVVVDDTCNTPAKTSSSPSESVPNIPSAGADAIMTETPCDKESSISGSSSNDSDSTTTDDEGNTTKRTKTHSGSYDVTAAVDSPDEALTSSDLSDNDDVADNHNNNAPAARNDDAPPSPISSTAASSSSSSGSADTDTDDTGTVADRKPKRFSRVFVVNKNDYSSSSDEGDDDALRKTSGSDSDSTSSDNDTDVERDCYDNGNSADSDSGAVVLTCMKPLRDEDDLTVSDKPLSLSLLLNRDDQRAAASIDGDKGGRPSHTNGGDEKSSSPDLSAASGAESVHSSSSTASANNIKLVLNDDDDSDNDGDDDVTASPAVMVEAAVNCNVRLVCGSAGESTTSANSKNSEIATAAAVDYCDSGSRNSSSTAALGTDQHHVEAAESCREGDRDSQQQDKQLLPRLIAEGTATAAGVAMAVPIVATNNNSSTARNIAANSVESECSSNNTTQRRSNAARYTSLVMITQESPPTSGATSTTTTKVPTVSNKYPEYPVHRGGSVSLSQVSVVTTNTTTVVPTSASSAPGNNEDIDDVVVHHTNLHHNNNSGNSARLSSMTISGAAISEKSEDKEQRRDATVDSSDVKVITGADTLSAVVCLEEGLADDDSWVENLSHDDDNENEDDDDDDDDDEDDATSPEDDMSSGEEVTLYCTAAASSASSDREDDLRGYNRAAIDFTLHTIFEESCEDSEVESTSARRRRRRPASATDLERYFYYGLGAPGDGTVPPPEVNSLGCEDAYASETSSVCSESIDSYVDGEEDDPSASGTGNDHDPAELASSRLEKYFLSGFMGFTGSTARRDSDGSVGSDSEGRPSPEQRRKRLLRTRGTGRSHSSSLDNLITNSDHEPETAAQCSEHSSSSDTDTYYDEGNNGFDKNDGQFDTVKRKKCKKTKILASTDGGDEASAAGLAKMAEVNEDEYQSDEDGSKTPQPDLMNCELGGARSKHQSSRDSGFIGSCDDLINKDDKDKETAATTAAASAASTSTATTNTASDNVADAAKSLEPLPFKPELKQISEEDRRMEDVRLPLSSRSTPPATSLTRKDSFNNWSSDEETNLMMSKMRQFFKTMVANTNHAPAKLGSHTNASTSSALRPLSPSNKPIPSPRLGKASRCKPPQLVYFENELTRLMKTVPGIRDDQVREIVEYLSSEDTWSDSYDSSDYTSSDLESGSGDKSALQQQISDSCKQIISKFDANGSVDNEGDEGDGGISVDESSSPTFGQSQGFNRETAFVYQKLVASFEKMATGENEIAPKVQGSPPLIDKVMRHIGSRLVALMHEVSSGGESHASNSPKSRHYHRRLHQKLSNASTTTTEDDDSTCDANASNFNMEDGCGKSMYNLLPRSKSHDLLMSDDVKPGHSTGGGGSGNSNDVGEASDCERFSWRGSFESALLATDSRNKLSLIGSENSGSASSTSALAIVAAKRRSAGDLLLAAHKSRSREHLDRVRSCGSIGGPSACASEEQLWTTRTARRSSVPDSDPCQSADDDDDPTSIDLTRSTLPRSLTGGVPTTNSLPRLPTNAAAVIASSSVAAVAPVSGGGAKHHFLQNTAGACGGSKSARYRPPGFASARAQAQAAAAAAGVGVGGASAPKRAVSAPGLQPVVRRGRRAQHLLPSSSDDVTLSEAHSSPMLAGSARSGGSKSSTPSPVPGASRLGGGSAGSSAAGSQDWTYGGTGEDDIDRLVALHHQRTSLSSLGLRSDSMASVYSGAGDGRYGTVAVRGQVEFGLQYNYKSGSLEVHIKQCKDLAAVDTKRNRSDPYVKVYLLPDKSKGGKRKTKVRKHTLSPVFDECLKFQISLNGLETRTLWLTVWHSDMFGRNDFLGEVMMTLENKLFDDPTPQWYPLQERTEPFDEILSFKGDILVGLKFVPPDMTVHKKGKRSRGALHVLVKEAKCLTAIKANGLSDPFCKSYLLPDKGRGGKQKTSVVRRTVNPVWNHTFVYDDVTMQELAERCLELTVWDHDRLASNEFLGGVRFSMGTGKTYGKPVDWMDATGKEMSLWKSMLERPNFWVEGCLSLRPTLDNRAT